MDKATARQIFRNKRMKLTATERLKLEDLILIRFQMLGIHIPEAIMTFAPMESKNEYDPDLVMEYCRFKNPAVKFLYPVVKGKSMVASAVNDDASFVKNKWGIAEPEETAEEDPKSIPLIFMPLLAFDKEGGRVGFGKGYYDKFLSDCKNDIIKIGFSFFEPVNKISDIAEFDIPMTYCITPENVYEF